MPRERTSNLFASDALNVIINVLICTKVTKVSITFFVVIYFLLLVIC